LRDADPSALISSSRLESVISRAVKGTRRRAQLRVVRPLALIGFLLGTAALASAVGWWWQHVRAQRTMQRATGAEPAAATLSDSLADESRLLNDALTASRGGDPRRALALLSEHSRRFPHGQLEAEVALEQVRCFGALGDWSSVLLEVERAPDGLRADAELLSLEAEALSYSGRCDQALRVLERLTGRLPARATLVLSRCRADR
jgi:hypothetical protein